jgi:DNA modification methylase
VTIEQHSADAVDSYAPDAPVYDAGGITVYAGDVVEVLARLPDASVDAVCTDPPYALEFMGKDWDAPWRSGDVRQPGDESFTAGSGPFGRAKVRHGGGGAYRGESTGKLFQSWCQRWAVEALRVLKPGGHLLAFGGSRTYHRMACAIEDAGFEIRDCIAWLYGQGFPKSLNVSAALDAQRCRCAVRKWPYGTGDPQTQHGLRDVPKRRPQAWGGWPVCERCSQPVIPDGLGTAAKPAHEPIVVARKPLAGTVAQTVLAHGVGAINIDGCRVPYEEGGSLASNPSLRTHINGGNGGHIIRSEDEPRVVTPNTAGRWPANVVLDVDQADQLDAQSGDVGGGHHPVARGAGGLSTSGHRGQDHLTERHDRETGGASRYFLRIAETVDSLPARFRYTVKAGQDERVKVNGIAHPTVKPLELMRWLVRLVTPPGGTVLEPFAGSGTTVEACILEGFGCVAVERDPDYLPLIRQRIDRRRDPVAAVRTTRRDHDEANLFDLLGDES